MKSLRIYSSFIFLLMVLILACSRENQKESVSIDVMSYNIKFDDLNDKINGWEQRKHKVANLVSFYEPDFIGTQEGLLHQLQYLDSVLVDYNWIGVGRTDGGNQGEFSAIIFNEKKFELLAGSDSTIWLSKSPGMPGKSWDAAFPRILTWGKFKFEDSDRSFYVFNTHFDHIGDTARAESAKLIVAKINEVAGTQPVVLTGDFNVTPDEEPYAILTENDFLSDTHDLAEPRHIGPDFTYSGFEVNPDIKPRRIDYIFVNGHFSIGKHGAISDFNNGYYPSDHLPVISEIILPAIQ